MTTERVHFRLIQMPCCGHLFCNVNPRVPSHCPECGKFVAAEIKGCVLLSDEEAVLRYSDIGEVVHPHERESVEKASPVSRILARHGLGKSQS